MTDQIQLLLYATLLIAVVGCSNLNNKEKPTGNDTTQLAKRNHETISKSDFKKKPSDFIPEGFILYSKATGDLNKDGLDDYILMIKGTKKDRVINHEYRGELDRNRRGIIVLFKDKGSYKLALRNDTCFSSDNEEGGVYYAPELEISTDHGKLFVDYNHGRYGSWQYTFQYRNSEFQLIGYEASENYGPIVNRETSINFLTFKKQEKVNTNGDAESGEEVFEETWTNLEVQNPILLSEIENFDELSVD